MATRVLLNPLAAQVELGAGKADDVERARATRVVSELADWRLAMPDRKGLDTLVEVSLKARASPPASHTAAITMIVDNPRPIKDLPHVLAETIVPNLAHRIRSVD